MSEVTSVSPRIDPRLLEAAIELDDPREPIAETCRRVGRRAQELGLTRPGYDSIRLLVREHRRNIEQARELLAPVFADALQGRVGWWDIERVMEASRLARPNV